MGTFQPTLEEILIKICNHYSVDVKKVKGIDRYAKLVKVRQIYAYISSLKTSCSREKIGFVINRNHSSITHSIFKIRGLMEIYSDFKEEMETIENFHYERKIDIVVEDVDLLELTNSWSKTILST